MRLVYRTAKATFIQFVCLSLLAIVNTLDSIVTTCSSGGHNCVSNMVSSTLFFLVLVGFFAVLWVLGFNAQDRRSWRLALLLIAVEGGVILVESFNALHHTSLLSLLTSIIDIGFAVWVIILAWRLSRAKGSRIVASERSRERNRPAL